MLPPANTPVLPDGYRPLLSIDLQKDKRLMKLVNAVSIAILLVALMPAIFLAPAPLNSLVQGKSPFAVKLLTLLAGFVAYVFLHEAVHGVAMYHYVKIKPHFGFNGMYAYAGSTAYYNKRSYIVIALAPIVVWGVVLAALGVLVPSDWFWVAYIIQLLNLSGAAGDLYVVWRFGKLPADILVLDNGVSMEVFGYED